MKNSLSFFACFLIFFYHVKAQTSLNFQSLTGMNVGRGTIASTGDNNFFYVSNGFSSAMQYTSICEKYSIASDSWSILTDSLIPKQFPSSVVVGNNLYVFGGILNSSGVRNAKMEIVDLSTGSITLSTNNPYPTSSAGAAVWNTDIYVFGGSTQSSGFSNKLYKFNTLNQTWTQLADMPEAKETKGEIVNGKLYVLGGYLGTSSARIDVYNIQTDTWAHLGDMPNGISGHSVAAYGSGVFTVFDFTDQTYLGYFDIQTNNYSVLTETNMTGRRNAGARIVNNRLYIMGGNTSSLLSSCLASLQVADLSVITTGIEEIKKSFFGIYPNPANDILFLKNYPKNSEITISDLTGKVIIDEKLTRDYTDISKLVNGIYILKIADGNNMIHTKFAKQ